MPRSLLLWIQLQLLSGGLAVAQAPPPYHPLGPIEARSAMLLSSASFVRPHADGSVLVHDIRGRRLVRLNAALDSMVTIADRAGRTGIAYSSPVGGMIAWYGDSTLFVDPSTYSMLILDERDRMVRVIAMPPVGLPCFIGGPSGMPALDEQGRIVCRLPRAKSVGPRSPMEIFTLPEVADTTALIRYDLASRIADTVTFLHVGKLRMTYFQNESCHGFISPLLNPLPTVDDWAVSPDGSIAVIRGASFRIERFGGAGPVPSSSRIPHHERRMSDKEKSAYIDSTKASLEKLRGGAASDNSAAPTPAEALCDPRRPRGLLITQPEIADDPVRIAAGAGSHAPSPLVFVPASDLPDYVPQFTLGSVRSDAAGNIWIRTLEAVGGGSVYDVIDRSDKLDRVLVPPGRVISGFGKGGVVYMGVAEEGGVRLERARYRPAP